jgi:hypothetical protein
VLLTLPTPEEQAAEDAVEIARQNKLEADQAPT